MKTVTVKGFSDDLVEVCGGVCEEFSHYSAAPCYLRFSDETVVKCRWDREFGLWRFSIQQSGKATTYCENPADEDGKVTLTGFDLSWVEFWQDYPISEGNLIQWFNDWLELNDYNGSCIGFEQLKGVYRAITGREVPV